MATDDPIIGNECWLYVSADRTTITEGDSVQFTVGQVGACDSSSVVNIYINDSIVYTGQLSNNSLSYVHIFTEPGEFTVYADNEGLTSPGNFIDITVEEDIVELPTSQVSWEINNKNVQSIEINNKEVKSIITSNGQVLYNKEEDAENVLEMQFTGSNFSTYSNTSPFAYTGDVFVDWGDNTGLIEYTGGKLSHSYSVNDAYTIKIYGNITSLETHCFDSCSGLTSVIIPDSVTSFGSYCFYNCSGLTSIIIPDGITSIGDYCFSGCSGLTSVIIPDSVTNLGESCFNNCSGLTSIIISDGVTNLKNSCFVNCSSLTSMVIPDSVISLGNSCFGGCSSLTSIIIPNSVTNLGLSCFNSCSGLTSIIISDSVTSFGDYCFYGCSNIISINLNWDTSNKILTYNSDWIYRANSNLKFIIPNGTTSLYTAKGYPSNKLIEIGNISLSSDKNILSYYDNDTATLSATVTSPSNEPVSGVTVEFFNGLTSMGTAITDSNGIATKTYDSTGAGDISFVVQVGMVDSSEYDIEDCWQVIPVGNRTGFNSNLAPTPLIITGTTKKDGNWGGTRFYGKDNGTTAINYVYLSQHSNNSSENEKIRYNLSTTTETFKIIINDGTVELYINDVLRNSVNCNTTYPLQISGGSSSNPVNITNIKVKAYQSKQSSTEEPTDELSGSELDP